MPLHMTTARYLAPLAALPSELAARFLHSVQRQRGRRALARLDARLLDDLGLSPAERDLEVAKSIWTD